MADKDPYALSTQGYGDSKQILMAIDTLSKLEAAGTIRPAEQKQLDTLRTLAPTARGTTFETEATYNNAIPALARGVAQGVSFGGADEVGAYLDSLKGADYEKSLEAERAKNRLYEKYAPTEYGGGKAIGTVGSMALPIGVAGNIARGAELGAIGTTALGAGEGAALASAPQFLEGEGGFTNRMRDVDPKMALLGAGIGGLAGNLSGVGQANDKKAFLEWLDKIKAPDQSARLASGMQFYRPNQAEIYDMFDISRTPTQAEDAYLYIRHKADQLRAAGASREEILKQTGMLDMPTKGVGGEDAGRTTWAAVDVNDLEALRPSRKTNYGYDVQYVPLEPNLGGMHYANERRIKVNSTHPPHVQERTLAHEMSHADQAEANIAYPLVGTNPNNVAYHRAEIIRELKGRIAAEPDKAKAAQLKESLKKLKGMTSLELYMNNPGEMLARLAEGNPVSRVRLTASELLNPHINARPTRERITNALGTALTSETRPYMAPIKRGVNNLGEVIEKNVSKKVGAKLKNANITKDYHEPVEMNLDKAVVTNTDYLQWVRAGKPLGNFNTWVHQGKP